MERRTDSLTTQSETASVVSTPSGKLQRKQGNDIQVSISHFSILKSLFLINIEMKIKITEMDRICAYLMFQDNE